MSISKIIFFFVVCIINANTYVGAQNDALKVYDLKGNPSMLRFRSFKLSLDSLTGKLKVGEEMDQVSTESYRVHFSKSGKEAAWHYISNGKSCTSMQYGTDGMGKYYAYQIHNNEIEKYTVEQIYEPEKRCGDCMIRSKLKKIYEFSFNNVTDTISSVVADTVMEMMKNDLLLASYQSAKNIQVEYYYEVHQEDSFVRTNLFKDIMPQLRIVRVYQNEKLDSEHRYDAKGEETSRKRFTYDKLGRLVMEREDFQRVEVSSGEYMLIDSLSTNEVPAMPKEGYWQYRYEYDSPMDEKGNWLSRNVFWQTDEHPKEQPVWREERKIRYYQSEKMLRGYR